MCINPSFIWQQRGPRYEQVPVACRQCWRCQRNRVNDYVGRAMCEASTAQSVCTLTLTYAPRDDLADKILHPRHFQLFAKLLRRAGHKIRYLVAGEYGELKGRAHFHVILFFQHLVNGTQTPSYNPGHLMDPETSAPFSDLIPQQTNVHIREWPHGHVFCDWSASEKSVRYICKYLLKGRENGWFSLSKKPALGAEWFAQKAATARELGVLPYSFEYTPPGCSRDRPYLMTGATRRDYLNAITTDPNFRNRMSEWVGKTFDKYQKQRVQAYLESQPIEVLTEAFNEYRQLRAYQFEGQKRTEESQFVDFLHEQLAKSDNGILRQYGGEWMPESEAKERAKQNGV